MRKHVEESKVMGERKSIRSWSNPKTMPDRTHEKTPVAWSFFTRQVGGHAGRQSSAAGKSVAFGCPLQRSVIPIFNKKSNHVCSIIGEMKSWRERQAERIK
jgi:hypothetical protein